MTTPLENSAAQRAVAKATAGGRARRVLFMGHTAVLGGAELAMLRLVRALDRSRYVPVVLLFSEGPLVKSLVEMGVETHVLPVAAKIVKTDRNTLGGGTLFKVGSITTALGFTWRLATRIRQLNVDLLHTNSLKADILGSIANLRARKPLIWYVHDRIAADYMPRRVVKVLQILARRMPDFLLANSVSSMENVAMGRTDRCAVAYPGVDAGAFVVGRVHRDDEPPVVGLVGRVSPTKGQDVFIQAAARVLRKIPGARFRIIGAALFNEAGYEKELRRMAEELRLGDALTFAGFCDDVPGAIGELDVLVHASTVPEPFGQVVAEGMAAGKAVVATRAGGIPEVVVEGETGLMVRPGDVEGMADAIERLLLDRDLARRMGEAGRKRALELFTIERTARDVQAAYDAVMTARGSGGAGRSA